MKQVNNVEIGKIIKDIRKSNGDTQERLAETLYGGANYIGKSEWSQHYPSLKKIECLAEVLQVKAFEFYIENWLRPSCTKIFKY